MFEHCSVLFCETEIYLFSICQKDQKRISQGTAFPSEELVFQRFILILILQEKTLSIYLNFACFDSFYVGLMV